jgi:copper chaperone
LEYVRKRHTNWYEELIRNEHKAGVKVEEQVKERKVQVEAKGKEEMKQVQAQVEEGDQEEVKVEAERKRGGENEFSEAGSRKEEDQMAAILKVKGMSCQHCVISVTKALTLLEGIKNVQVDLAKGEVRFDNTNNTASDRIQKAIEDAGYEVISA